MSIIADASDNAEGGHDGPPARLGQRYTATHFLPEAGNTVVCHLDTGHPGHHAVLASRARLKALPGAERFLFTAPESLHMTVFEGVIETRRTPDAWPGDLDRNASVDSVTKKLLKRLADFPEPPPFNVRIAALRPTGLLLEGATSEDEMRLRALRDALAARLGYRQAGHDDYRFHMTFAYPVDWIPDDQVEEWNKSLANIAKELASATPVLPLRPPAFCQFKDMNFFEELLVLGT